MQQIYNRLSGRKPSIVDESSHLISAVLLPLVEKDGKCHILFEVRSRHLNRQPGEICFPGGRVESSEHPDPLAAALRETAEELGIPDSDIEPIGPLDILVTPLSAVIYPYVGKINTTEINPNPREVEETFLVPVDFFLSVPPFATCVEVATRYQPDFPLHKVPPVYKEGWQIKSTYPMYFYEYGKYFIWGMTGKILFNFLTTCWPEHPVFKKPFRRWQEEK
ncbi:MAG: CoA pyrophosphatase [Peptococcaceae bacterium]|nr:CoA pyrophosphatase [Peptococcaceae bacterium]